MKNTQRLILTLSVILTLSFSIFPKKAYAYLDPGSGSYLFQLLLASLLGGIFTIKLFWKNIKTFFTSLLSKRKDSEKDQE